MSLSVIIPVRDGEYLVGEAVSTFLEQVTEVGGEVIVADDASSDSTSAVAERAGAEVIRLDRPSGPYAARNHGWAAAEHEVLAFVDVRCRPRQGWARSVLNAFESPEVALMGGAVTVLPHTSVAGRAVEVLAPFDLGMTATHAFFPFAPTCHLAARRSVVEKVGGFAATRGAADVDLCWKVQHAGLGHFTPQDSAVVTWSPRTTLRGLLEQFRRYGRNHGRLARAWASEGCPTPQTNRPVRVALHHLRDRPLREEHGLAVASTVSAALAAMESGVREGLEIDDPLLGPLP